MIWIDNVLVSCGEGGVYGERLLKECRVWDPYRSKLAAFYYLCSTPDLTHDMRVLYLGAANGTTVSHVADYVECVYAVEMAPRPIQDLLAVAGRRGNVIPIMADARRVESFAPLLEVVDLIYQDVAQPDQVAIAIRNSIFLRRGGTLIIVLKTRSISVAEEPEIILQQANRELECAGFDVTGSVWLKPYHKDHAVLVCSRVPGG
ncbi:MAG TPA: fibrillarin-like rRNA/tRNA 2'-O-methyltransferase [Methanoregulaceae archaeon]|nr:fibrillarin-like rRNA/tRNA 2'-O-methyltransferase [Methanoregulaceae archaeon]